MVGIREGVTGPLDRLRGLGDGYRLPTVDQDQVVVELPGREVRIAYLIRRAPPLRRALLEEAKRVTVAVVEVAQVRFLDGRGKRHGHGVRGQVLLDGGSRDESGVIGLFGRERGRHPVDGHRASRR